MPELNLKDGYSESDIIHKEGVDAIRQNAAMYVGDTSYNGWHHLASEVIDNSVDEALAGYATRIDVCLHLDGSCSVSDNGRGIPADPHPEYKVSTLEVIMTRLHSSGKYEKTAYKKYSSGLHGLGLKASNSLSDWLTVIVQREGKKYYQKYVEGKALAPVEVVGSSASHGTVIRFKPSRKIFRDIKEFDREWFLRRLRDLAYLNPGLELQFKDERDPAFEKNFIQKGGILAYVSALIGDHTSLLKESFYASALEPDGIVKEDGTQDEMKIELSFNYHDSDAEVILAFTNNVHNKDGGTQVAGFTTALTTTFNNHLKRNADIIPKKEQKDLEGKALRGEDYRQGLAAVISVKLSRPNFAGQTKDRLTNVEVQSSVRVAIGKVLNKWIEENPEPTKKIIEKAVLNFRSYLASKKAAETVKKGSTKSLFNGDSKLVDCTIDDPENAELFLVEGDSAAGSVVDARHAQTQAVMPLRGKILNTWKATAVQMLAHKELNSLIRALGTGILDDFEATACRYNKIIITCDADQDGRHIRTLLLTFFFQRMRKLIEDGKIYIAQPPLYSYDHKYKKTKCPECKDANKSVRCSLCSGSGKKQEFITYEADFLSVMTSLGLEDPLLTRNDGKTWAKEDFSNIFNSAKTANIEDLKNLGFTEGEIREQIVVPGEDPVYLFKLENVTGAKAVEFTNLLGLPKVAVQLGQNCVNLKRYKGLGEMNFAALAISTIDPKTRTLLQIKIEDLVGANAKFEILMGNKAELRRDFIADKKSYK